MTWTLSSSDSAIACGVQLNLKYGFPEIANVCARAYSMIKQSSFSSGIMPTAKHHHADGRRGLEHTALVCHATTSTSSSSSAALASTLRWRIWLAAERHENTVKHKHQPTTSSSQRYICGTKRSLSSAHHKLALSDVVMFSARLFLICRWYFVFCWLARRTPCVLWCAHTCLGLGVASRTWVVERWHKINFNRWKSVLLVCACMLCLWTSKMTVCKVMSQTIQSLTWI